MIMHICEGGPSSFYAANAQLLSDSLLPQLISSLFLQRRSSRRGKLSNIVIGGLSNDNGVLEGPLSLVKPGNAVQ